MFIVQEIQTTKNSTALVPAQTFADKNQAESAWHLAMGAAAISAVEVHTVLMYDEHGNVVKSGFYEHIPEPAPNEAE